MSDSNSIQAAQTAANETSIRFAETGGPINSTQASSIDQNTFLSSILLADLAPPTAQSSGDALATSTGDAQANITDEALLNLNLLPPSLFNEVPDATTTNSGPLTSQQLQEIAILQEDALKLEEASSLVTNIPLTNNSTTLDLSLIAQEIAAANSNVPLSTSTPGLLTTAQLQQIAQIITPFLNEPLTPAILLQIQTQLAANQINVSLFSLNAIFLVQNYIVNMQATQNDAIRTNKKADSSSVSMVNPVSSIDKVAVEDSAIVA